MAIIRTIIPRMYVKGEDLYKLGQESNGIYLILKGTVSVMLSSDNRVPILNLNDGSFYGENFTINSKYDNTFRATSKSIRCLFIPKESLNILLNSNDEYRQKLKNLAIFKKAIISLEELKFNDRVVVIVNKMIDLKQGDKKVERRQQKFKTQIRWYKKDRTFKELVKTALKNADSVKVEVDKNGDVIEGEHQNAVIEDYILKLYPEKSMDKLQNLQNEFNKFVNLNKCSKKFMTII